MVQSNPITTGSTSPTSPPNRARVVGRLAWTMRFVGIFLFILGLCSLANGAHEAMGQRWTGAFQWGGPGLMWLSLGFSAIRGAGAFGVSVKTGADDALTRGLDQLRHFFTVLTVFAVLSIGILTLNLVLLVTHAH